MKTFEEFLDESAVEYNSQEYHIKMRNSHERQVKKLMKLHAGDHSVQLRNHKDAAHWHDLAFKSPSAFKSEAANAASAKTKNEK